MEHLHIVMGNHLKEDKKIIEKYAKDVFSYYNGKLQKSNLEGFKGHYRLHLKNTIPIPIITITFEPSFSQRIGLIVQESYFSSKAFPKKEAESKYLHLLSTGKFLFNLTTSHASDLISLLEIEPLEISNNNVPPRETTLSI